MGTEPLPAILSRSTRFTTRCSELTSLRRISPRKGRRERPAHIVEAVILNSQPALTQSRILSDRVPPTSMSGNASEPEGLAAEPQREHAACRYARPEQVANVGEPAKRVLLLGLFGLVLGLPADGTLLAYRNGTPRQRLRQAAME